MNKIFKSSVWALSLLLVSSSTLSATLDSAIGAKRVPRSGADIAALKQKYAAKYEQWKREGKIKKTEPVKEAAKTQAKQEQKKRADSSLQVRQNCPSPLPKPKKKCISADRLITNQLCATDALIENGTITNATIENLNVTENANIRGDLSVEGNASINGDITVNGAISGGTFTADRITANRANFDVETTNVSYEDVNVIEDLRVWQTERFVTPNYDRFPDGALPQTTKIGPGETYEFTSLSPQFVPISGNDWNAIIHGIIDFDAATDQEKLDFYSGAAARLFYLMMDFPFSATKPEYQVGETSGGIITTNSTVMPADQQRYAAKAFGVILNGLLSVNPDKLDGKNRVTLFNLITMARFYIRAWSSATTTTNILGVEYFGSANPANIANYLYPAAIFPPAFLNLSILPAFGYSSDGPALLSYARALPGLYKQYAGFIQNQLDVGLAGMKEGYYPHVLRNRPFSAPGQSTFGQPGYGYAPDIVALVQSGEFPVFDEAAFRAMIDFNLLLPATFEDQLSPDLIFSPDGGIIGGFNLQFFLDMLVEQGVMDQTEADYLQEEARKAYDEVVKPQLLNWYNTLWIDPNSPFVRALRLTQFDDFPGEWGYKFIVHDGKLYPNGVNAEGDVKGIVKNTGQVVYINPLGEEVVIRDEFGNIINISLKDITLQRDEAAGNEHYTNMTEIILKVNRGPATTGGTPIPFFKKVSDTPNVNPFNNWRVNFDDSATSLPEKLHFSGQTLVDFFSESIDFYLDAWVIANNPCGATPPPTKWQDCYPTRDAAIAAIKEAGRMTGDLEDPAKGGLYAFVQHYQPISDGQGPLYDFSQIEAYYTEAWDGVPQLKLTADGRIDGAPVVDRNGNVIYDPQAPVDPKTGLINVDALFALSQVDNDKANYYAFLSQQEIVEGKAARVYYFIYDFVKHSFEDYLTIGKNPLLNYYFSPYIVAAFNKLCAHTYFNFEYASGSSFDPISQIITYTHLVNYPDPRNSGIGDRTTILHEFIMGHSLQIPLTQMINSTGTGSWLTGVTSNAATAEGWAVFIETFFGPQYTSYLSPVDHYWNYIDPQGRPDPVTLVPSITDTARVAARLKWDTAVHSSLFEGSKASMAQHAEGFKKDTFDNFPITTEISQRIPEGPTQGLNYGLGFMQIVGLFQTLPTVLGQERYDELQANGNKATKYFFDLLLLDAQGYFISSLDPIYLAWAERVKNKVPPFDDPNYEGYPVDAFDAHTVPYEPGTNPIAYEFIDNPYVPGGFTFNFPACPVPNTGVCPSPTGAVVGAKKAPAVTAVSAVKATPAITAVANAQVSNTPAAQLVQAVSSKPTTATPAPKQAPQYASTGSVAKKAAVVQQVVSQKK